MHLIFLVLIKALPASSSKRKWHGFITEEDTSAAESHAEKRHRHYESSTAWTPESTWKHKGSMNQVNKRAYAPKEGNWLINDKYSMMGNQDIQRTHFRGNICPW